MITELVMWLALAPKPAPLKAELDKLIAQADADVEKLTDRCREPSLPDHLDLEAEQVFLKVAALRRAVIEYYPYGGDEAAHSDDVHQVAQFYERAFNCNPGPGQRRYLSDAVSMVDARLQASQGNEDILQGFAAYLRNKLAQYPERLLPPPCPTVKPEPQPVKEKMATGYRRWMGQLSLRFELGGSFLSDFRDAPPSKAVEQSMLTLSVSPGLRFVAGKGQRHVLGVGFRYSAWIFSDPNLDHVDRMAARMEYGIRLHPQWLSVHAGFEPGIQVHAASYNAGSVQLEGWGALCTWGEAFCLRVGGSRSVWPTGSFTYFDHGFATVGTDVFRVADRVQQRWEGRHD